MTIARSFSIAEEAVKHEDCGDTNCSRCSWKRNGRLKKWRTKLEIRGRIETILITELLRSTRILRIVLNDLKTLAVTKTPVKDRHLVFVWKTRKEWNDNKKKPADHRVKLKESKKKDKYLDLARELNSKITLIPIIMCALGTVTEELLKGLENLEIKGGVETIQTTALLNSVRILRRVLETWGDLWSLRLQWNTIS